MEEVYSIVKVVSDDILYCQRTSEPTAQWALENLVILLTETLEPNNPLEVRHVAPIGGDGSGPSSTLRPHEDLTEIGRQTRDSFRVAFAKRFLPRYGAGLAGRSHLFDRTMLLSPSGRKMKYVDRLLASTAAVGTALSTAAHIKAKIKAEVVSLLTKAIIEKRARDKKTKDAVGVDDTPVAKRPRSAGRGSAARAASTVIARRRRTAGLMDDSDDEVDTDSPVERDAHEEADAILQAWLTLQVKMGGDGACVSLFVGGCFPFDGSVERSSRWKNCNRVVHVQIGGARSYSWCCKHDNQIPCSCFRLFRLLCDIVTLTRPPPLLFWD